jgi:hypothetical protein
MRATAHPASRANPNCYFTNSSGGVFWATGMEGARRRERCGITTPPADAKDGPRRGRRHDIQNSGTVASIFVPIDGRVAGEQVVVEVMGGEATGAQKEIWCGRLSSWGWGTGKLTDADAEVAVLLDNGEFRKDRVLADDAARSQHLDREAWLVEKRTVHAGTLNRVTGSRVESGLPEDRTEPKGEEAEPVSECGFGDGLIVLRDGVPEGDRPGGGPDALVVYLDGH